jgi:transposase
LISSQKLLEFQNAKGIDIWKLPKSVASLSEIFRDEYLTNAPKSRRPRALDEAREEELAEAIRRDRCAREKSSLTLGAERSISASTVQRIFKRRGIHKLKSTRKPSLTVEIKTAQLWFCQEHKDWTLEDWKTSFRQIRH